MSLRTMVVELREKISALDRLTDAKFVTVKAMMEAEAERVRIALTATQTAIDKADIADEKARDRLSEDMRNRFESVNEFRGQQKDLMAGFMPRAEFDQFRERYTQQVNELKERLDKAEGRSGGVSGAWGVIVAVIGIAIAIGALVVNNI